MSLKPPVSEQDHMQGDPAAPIQLVEYGDYQCPHCGRAYPIVKRIQEKLGNKVSFVFRNFPLAEAHPNATNAAVASEAAASQGKFWEMHDILFEHQQNLRDTSLVKYAGQIGLDTEQFISDFEKEETLQKVESDFESGVRSGVNGTPTFFINGQKYTDSWEEDILLEYLKKPS